MLIRRLKAVGAMALCAAILLYGGIAFADSPCADKAPCAKATKCGLCDRLFHKTSSGCGLCNLCAKRTECKTATGCPPSGMTDLPPNAEPGECYAKVYVAAQFKTLTERHMVQEASERIEIVPAQFKWVEERIMVKEASTQLEVVPAEYKWTEKTIQVAPAHTGWVLQNAADCANPEKLARGDVFCLRTTPPAYRTIRTQCLAKAACVRSVTIPAEYQAIRREVVASAATTRRICTPAEYEDIQKTVLVCPERIKWEHVICEEKMTSETVNKVKSALQTSGYKPGPLNGKLTPEDWTALTAFQQKNGLGVGKLSYETLKQLQVSMQ